MFRYFRNYFRDRGDDNRTNHHPADNDGWNDHRWANDNDSWTDDVTANYNARCAKQGVTHNNEQESECVGIHIQIYTQTLTITQAYKELKYIYKPKAFLFKWGTALTAISSSLWDPANRGSELRNKMSEWTNQRLGLFDSTEQNK